MSQFNSSLCVATLFQIIFVIDVEQLATTCFDIFRVFYIFWYNIIAQTNLTPGWYDSVMICTVSGPLINHFECFVFCYFSSLVQYVFCDIPTNVLMCIQIFL